MFPVTVVADEPDLLATYTAEGTRFEFPPGDWPTPDGLHPWHTKETWSGHGTLMLQRPGERYAVWHFWTGPERTFQCWYLNLQEPFQRTADVPGYDTQDLELDIVVLPDRTWAFKDWDVLDERVREGRFTAEQVEGIREEGLRLGRMLDAGQAWWDEAWANWQP